MTRPRFSIRRLLLVTAAVAGFCFYRTLPRQNAVAFSRLIQAGDYAAAEALLTNRYRDLPARVPLSQYSSAARQWRTLTDWLLGQAFVHCADETWELRCKFVATASGVEPVYFEAAQFADEAQ